MRARTEGWARGTFLAMLLAAQALLIPPSIGVPSLRAPFLSYLGRPTLAFALLLLATLVPAILGQWRRAFVAGSCGVAVALALRLAPQAWPALLPAAQLFAASVAWGVLLGAVGLPSPRRWAPASAASAW